LQKPWLESAGFEGASIRTAFIDVDEFIVTHDGESLSKALQHNDATQYSPSWVFTWRSFGTSGLDEAAAPGNGLFSSFVSRVHDCDLSHLSEKAHVWDVHAALDECNKRFPTREVTLSSKPYRTKSICDTDWLLAHGGYPGANPHLCVRRAMTKGSAVIANDHVWIAHYNLKSKEEWAAKVARGRVNSGAFALEQLPAPADLHDFFSEELDLEAVTATMALCGKQPSPLCCFEYLLGRSGAWEGPASPRAMRETISFFCKHLAQDAAEMPACRFLLTKYANHTSVEACLPILREEVASASESRAAKIKANLKASNARPIRPAKLTPEQMDLCASWKPPPPVVPSPFI
jgi:hypothetical protein